MNRTSTILALAVAAAPFAAQVAAAATNPWPSDGVYHYDVISSGQTVGHADVLVASSANAISVQERLEQTPVTATSNATYATPALSLTSYSADFTTPGGSHHITVAIKPGVFTVSVPGETAEIAANPSAPLMIVGDNLVATLALTPAILHAAGAKSFTLAALRGGKAVLATVTPADPATRPGGVPAADAGSVVNVAGTNEVFWYDPQSFVLDDLHVPDEGIDVRLASHDGAAQLPAASPQPTALPTAPPHFTSRDVTFASADGVRLAGTLTIPGDVTSPLPAVVLVQGSGPEDRNETVGPNPVFLQLSNALSNAGYAVLRYDKRGIGASGGVADSPRSALLADVAAAFGFLAAQPQVDPKRIFLLGHSEGGELVPTVAATHPSVAGIVLMAPPALPFWQISLQQALDGVPPAQMPEARAREMAFLQSVRGGSNHDSGMVWYRSSMDVDPVADIKRVASPILILQGGSDVQVRPDDLPRLVAAAKTAKRNVTWYVFPGDNHLFMPVTPGESLDPRAALNQYLTVPGRIDPRVLHVMIAWLNTQNATR